MYIIKINKIKGCDIIMIITAVEFKTNFEKYLSMIAKEDIFITQNGKTIAKVSNPHISAVESISGILSGLLPENFDRKNLREERISEYETND